MKKKKQKTKKLEAWQISAILSNSWQHGFPPETPLCYCAQPGFNDRQLYGESERTGCVWLPRDFCDEDFSLMVSPTARLRLLEKEGLA